MGLKLGKYKKFVKDNLILKINIFFFCSSHLRMQDFKEVTKQLHQFQWENDEVLLNINETMKIQFLTIFI
jgi:hypothetical protein